MRACAAVHVCVQQGVRAAAHVRVQQCMCACSSAFTCEAARACSSACLCISTCVRGSACACSSLRVRARFHGHAALRAHATCVPAAVQHQCQQGSAQAPGCAPRPAAGSSGDKVPPGPPGLCVGGSVRHPRRGRSLRRAPTQMREEVLCHLQQGLGGHRGDAVSNRRDVGHATRVRPA